MSIHKNKSDSGKGSSHLNNQVRKGFLESNSISKKKTDDIPHSFFYLFDDDEDDYATLGRNISENTASVNKAPSSKDKKS